MDLTPYVETLRRDLATAARAGGDEAEALAERLVAPLESSVRLVLLDALSAAADEITLEVVPGSVEVRLRSGSPEFVVALPPPELPAGDGDDPAGSGAIGPEVPPAPAAAATGEGDDGATARITLRLPESLKPRIDDAASRAGLSANAWLVRVVSAALDPGNRAGRGATGATSGATGSAGAVPPPAGPRTTHGRRFQGWVS
jgi:hypothetical protein